MRNPFKYSGSSIEPAASFAHEAIEKASEDTAEQLRSVQQRVRKAFNELDDTLNEMLEKNDKIRGRQGGKFH